jgi:hypothetical protein
MGVCKKKRHGAVNTVEKFSGWYSRQCNGEWEHQYGVRIETSDNPGWIVTIDIAKTDLDGVALEPVIENRNERDWLYCEIADKKFVGNGDAGKLERILEIFTALCGDH